MKNNIFTLVVIGENPNEIIKPYSNSINVEPYVLYEFDKAGEYRKKYIDSYEKLLNGDISDNEKSILQMQLDYYKSIDDITFYCDLTEGMELDEETGNVLTTRNPKGKYDTCNVGCDYSNLLIKKDGTKTFSAKKSDIDWSKMHLYDQGPFISAWETVVEGRQPKDDEEKKIYENMKSYGKYLSFFKDKETYVKVSTSFWGFAVVDENKWSELEDYIDQNVWISNFYDIFIKNLSEDTTISIYECVRNK